MIDYRELDVWNDARRLTLAAFELTKNAVAQHHATKLTAEIEQSCIEMLSGIQDIDEVANLDFRTTIEHTVGRIGLLFAEACKQGLIGTIELSLILREVDAVRDSLNGIGSIAYRQNQQSARA